MYFVSDGVAGLIRLIISLIKLVLPVLGHELASESGVDEMLVNSKLICRNNIDITSLMKVRYI
jgi:TLD